MQQASLFSEINYFGSGLVIVRSAMIGLMSHRE
jgi:hypothetical protein